MASHEGESESTPPLDLRDPAALVGREIGDFEVIREIGRGGMGTVFQARQKSLNRMVALKVLSSGLGLTPTSVLRFQREAQAAASLHHDNIVPIHAQGETDGVYYYAMEFIRGENVHDLIRRARDAGGGSSADLAETELLVKDDPAATVPLAPVPEVVSVGADDSAASDPRLSRGAPTTARQFERIAGLIAAVAGALDYAHEQGVIHRDVKPHNLILGDDGRIYILDFGLARVLEQPGVTITGEFVGSPLYMSPEQIVGGRRKIDKRTDIYSLGATLYEWLTLSPPYPGETREQVISKIITSDPPAPRSLNPQIPVDLETICVKALEKDADRRYGSAGEMYDDLRRFLSHETIRARRAGVLSRARKFVLRNKVASIAAAALVVAVTLSFALVYQAKKSRGRVEEIAAISEEKAEQLEQKTVELQQTAKKAEEQENQLAVLRALIETAEKEKLFEKSLSVSEHDPLAQRMFNVFVDRQRARAATRREARLGPVSGAAHDLYLQALASEDLDQAASLVRECLRLDPGHLGGETLAAALAGARHEYGEMLAHSENVVRRRPDEPDGHLLRGAANLMSGDLQAGIADFNAAVERDEGLSWAFVLRGVAYLRGNEHARAERDFDSALARSPDNVVALLERARARAYLKNYEAAIADAGRVIELEADNVDAYVFRGECHDALGRYDESSADYNRAMALDPVSVRIVAKLWQANANRKKAQESDATDAGDVKVPDAPPKTDEPAPVSDAGAGRGRFEWFKRWLEREGPTAPRRDMARLQFCRFSGR